MASEDEFQSWATAKNYRRIAAELVQLERDRGGLDLDLLSTEPETGLEANPEVGIEYDEKPLPGCSVYGYYRYNPDGRSTILVHPALTSERDNFTIVHELGHHVQRQHLVWADVRHGRFPGEAGIRLEERVADAFAAEVLIPTSAFSGTAISASALSHAYDSVRASRAAVAMRVVDIAADTEQAAVVVVDHHGVVLFARAIGDDVFAPARGQVQPGLAQLVTSAIANGGSAAGPLSTGLQSKSGWVQHELNAEVALDHTWGYGFAVIRPAQRYGREPVWDRRVHVCPREACGTVFEVNPETVICPTCRTPKCPECSTCACEPKLAPVCPDCWVEFTMAEQANPALHQC